MGKYGRASETTDDSIIGRMRIACWMNKVTRTHSEYIRLAASPPQHWLRQRASVLRYMYITCLILKNQCFQFCAMTLNFLLNQNNFVLTIFMYKL